MSDRPRRTRVTDELGREATLAQGERAFQAFGAGGRPIYLGLGPDPASLPAPPLQGIRGLYVECPEFARAMGPNWQAAIPEWLDPIDPAALTAETCAGAGFLFYAQNMRLFPSFWGPVVARAMFLALGREDAPPRGEVWYPAPDAALLVPETALAFESRGYLSRRLEPTTPSMHLAGLLARSSPEIFFSVNFKGLDPLGENFHLLEQAGARVAVWCVDNPFHLISALRSPFWRRVHLFVTDHWFIEPLKEHGAESVHHLPLAASPAMLAKGMAEPLQEVADRLVFVGRSRFPDKERFFAGQHLEEGAMAPVGEMLARGLRPHYGWWREKLGRPVLWPGNEARRVGLGAEESARLWRARCLDHASDVPLAVYGDRQWKELVPALEEVRPEVDYYAALPGLYARAGCVLNVTSLLLPGGLTQRHFDVWACGAPLISDATRGLSLFPRELVRPMVFREGGDIPVLARRWMAPSREREDFVGAWKKHILANHTYEHRADAVLAVLEGAA